MPEFDFLGYLNRKRAGSSLLPPRLSLDAEVPPPAPSESASLEAMLDRLQPAPQPTGARAAIGRALTGFSRGARAVPEEARYSGVLGGLVGGLSGIGQSFEAEADRARQADQPRQQLLQAIMESQAKEQVQEPFRIGREKRAATEEARQIELRDKLQRDRMRLAGQQRARELGVSEQTYSNAQGAAQTRLLLSGVNFDSPDYPFRLEQETLNELRKRKTAGVKGTEVVPPSSPGFAVQESTGTPAAAQDPLGNILFGR